MKTELEVARDAVRSAGLEELADALEWAAAAVKHRRALMFAAVDWFLSEAPCPECGHRSVHNASCETAAALHALSPDWSREELISAHSAALNTLRAVRGLILPTLGGNRIPPRPPFPSLHPPIIPTLGMQPPWRRVGERITTADGMTWELRVTGPALSDGVTRRAEWFSVAASPQPAQPQPEDDTAADVTPPASPPPAR